MIPRPYQREAIDALCSHLETKDTNPCVVLPTGAGKSPVIAWTIQRWKRGYPPLRAMVLAHRKELVQQNAEKLSAIWPEADVGVYSASAGRRDQDQAIIYASIDSVYNKWNEFPPFNVLLIDEAHRIPARGEGKYQSFIKGCRKQNPKLKVVGFTATPFRMSMGPICHEDHILQEICYEAHVVDLIRDGYLCPLRSKIGDGPDLTKVKKRGGEYSTKSLAAAVDTPQIVQKAVRDAMRIVMAEGRRSVVLFCVDVKHAHDVSLELRRYGVNAPVVTGKTSPKQRDKIVADFKQGRYRALCNVNVFTEGFDAPRVDCVVLMRPTLSSGLYTQMVGRGLRLHPDKDDCLVLDYARCIEEHGPIDALEPGDVKLVMCGIGEENAGCGCVFSRALRECPHCGWVIPKREVERHEAEEERKKRMHEEKAAQASIIGGLKPEWHDVDGVTIRKHTKPGSPDSICVQYRCGLQTYREWVCLDHERGSFAWRKAMTWWASRFGQASAKTITVEKALGDLFTAVSLSDMTKRILVSKRGKHAEIINYKLDIRGAAHA